MPKLRSDVAPKYRLHKPTGRALVSLGGRRVYLGKHGTKASRAEYERVVGEWMAKGRPDAALQDALGDGDGCTVNELLLAYLRHATRYYAAGGEIGCMKDAMKVVKALYGRTPVASFGPLALKAVRAKMVAQDWARTYVNHQTNRVRRIFKWGVENELVPPAVLHGLQAVAPLRYGRCDARESEPVKPVPETFVDAVLGHVAPPVAAMIELQRRTSMRPGEVVIMRACDIDMTGRVWLYRPSDHKNKHRGHDRVVFLGPKAQEIIRPFFKPATEAYLFSPADAVAAKRAERSRDRVTPLSCGNRPGTNRKTKPKRLPGERYDVLGYRQAIARGCDRADVPRWTPNQLRHNGLTAIRRQHGLEAARIIGGHKTAAVTEIYAEADVARARQIMLEMG